MSDQLPEGWAWTVTADLAAPLPNALTIGPFGSNLKVSDYTAFGVPLVFVRDIRAERFGGEGMKFVSASKAAELASHAVRGGDLLITKMGEPPGDTAIYPLEQPPGVITADCIKLTPDLRMTGADFLRLCVRSKIIRDQLAEQTMGVAQQKLSLARFRGVRVPLPPLREQQRIVETVVALLEQVGRGNERLDRVSAILKRFRQAVLAAACSGELTKEWRRARTDSAAVGLLGEMRRIAEEARGRERKAVAAAPDLDVPAGWASCRLGEIAVLVTSGSRGWAEFYSEDGPLFVRAQNLNSDRLSLEEMAHVQPPANSEGARTRVAKNDVLITITGANVTKTGLVERDLGEAYVSQHVGLVRPAMGQAARWIYLWLLSPQHGRKQLLDAAYGAGKPGLNLDNLRDVEIAFPSFDEQQETVRKVDGLLALADAIERQVQEAANRAKKLPQAILSKAFSGELVPTEAELARAEGRTYETAEELLANVRRETANGISKKGHPPASRRKAHAL